MEIKIFSLTLNQITGLVGYFENFKLKYKMKKIKHDEPFSFHDNDVAFILEEQSFLGCELDLILLPCLHSPRGWVSTTPGL
jgi:hypothetical protein